MPPTGTSTPRTSNKIKASWCYKFVSSKSKIPMKFRWGATDSVLTGSGAVSVSYFYRGGSWVELEGNQSWKPSQWLKIGSKLKLVKWVKNQYRQKLFEKIKSTTYAERPGTKSIPHAIPGRSLTDVLIWFSNFSPPIEFSMEYTKIAKSGLIRVFYKQPSAKVRSGVYRCSQGWIDWEGWLVRWWALFDSLFNSWVIMIA